MEQETSTIRFLTLYPMLAYAVLAFIYKFLYQYLVLHDRPPKGLKQIPGPTSTLPFLGRLHDIDGVAPWKSMHKFSDQYNKMFSMIGYGTQHIWIADRRIARELFVNRAAKYSSRPTLPTIPQHRTSGRYMSLNADDEHWRLQKRFTHAIFAEQHRSGYFGIIEPEVVRFLQGLVDKPRDHYNQTDILTARISARLGYGNVSEYARHTANANEFIAELSPTASGPLVNIFPFLWRIPECLNPAKRRVRERQEKETILWASEFARAKRSLKEGTAARYSYVKAYLDRVAAAKATGCSDFGFDEAEAIEAIGMLVTMAIFTIGGPLYIFMLVMVLNPDWQEKVREEVLQVVGLDRLTQLSDSPNLPILRACIKECFRWKPPVPLGVPHLVTQDDNFEGYYIPEGSVVHIVEQALSLDPEVYPEPKKYNPARWLESQYPSFQEPLTKYPRLNGFHGFGSGARTCPGIEWTQAELLIACGSLVQNFDLLPDVDSTTGEKKWPDPDNRTSNVIGGPLHFDFNLQVREGRSEKIRSMYDEVIAQGS